LGFAPPAERRYAGSSVLRAVVLSFVLLLCGAARAQPARGIPRPFVPGMPATSDPGRLARRAAIAGLVGAGLMLAGTLAIELADQPESEGVTRGVHLGFTALAAPLVAFAAYTVRRREGSEGDAVLRQMGWAFYAAAITLGVSQWYDALNDHHVPSGLGYLYGSLAVLSLLPQCFDAYISGRSARFPLLVVTPVGLLAKF
jgi:hypothetical protein